MNVPEKIGLFGGTFNPPHMGHVEAARACVCALGLDRMLLIPANLPPHKTLPAGSPTAQERLEMAALAAAMIPGGQACDIELLRGGASYTYETVEQISAMYPESSLWLLVGTDMLLSFARWRNPQRILAHCRLAAVARDADQEALLSQKAQELAQELGAGVDLVRHQAVPVSSTQVRDLRAYDRLPPDVSAYIEAHGLYGGVK